MFHAGLTVDFTEVDYRTTETDGSLTVVVNKNGDNVGPLSFILTPLTYSELIDMGFTLNETLGTLSMDDDLPDEAECKKLIPGMIHLSLTYDDHHINLHFIFLILQLNHQYRISLIPLKLSPLLQVPTARPEMWSLQL